MYLLIRMSSVISITFIGWKHRMRVAPINVVRSLHHSKALQVGELVSGRPWSTMAEEAPPKKNSLHRAKENNHISFIKAYSLTNKST